MNKEITALRVSQWYDRKKKAILYGVEGKVDEQWVNIGDGPDNYIRPTRKEATALILEISKELGWEEVGKKKQTPTDPNCLFRECNNPEVCNEKGMCVQKTKSNRL